jgi:hypothetical protein
MNAMTEPAPGLAADQAQPPEPAARTRQIDWERVEIDYRAGLMTLREIGEKHGLRHPSILRRAKRDGWDRDLAAKIQARAQAIVIRQAATKQVGTKTQLPKVTEVAVVTAEAQLIAGVQSRRRDRTDRLHAAFEAALAMAEKGAQSIPILADLRRMAETLPQDQQPGALRQIADLEDALAADAQITRVQRLMQSGTALSETEAHVYGLSRDAPLGSVPSGLEHFYPSNQELPEPRL